MKNQVCLIGFIIPLLIQIGCSKPVIFTELDISFRSIEEIFPDDFRNEKKSVEVTDSEVTGFTEFKRGRYGQSVALEVWEFTDQNLSRAKWEEIVNAEKKRNLTDFTRINGKELRFDYIRETGPSGMVWTNKMFLFRVLGETKETIKEFLKNTKLARLQ